VNSQDIIEELKVVYGMELETVQNYMAASVNLDGVRSDVIKKALAADIVEELGHAQAIAKRIKTIGGTVPGSFENKRSQESLQPLEDTTDVVSVIKGVIAAEEGAMAHTTRSLSYVMVSTMSLKTWLSPFSRARRTIGASS
jgi:bacterioferritin